MEVAGVSATPPAPPIPAERVDGTLASRVVTKIEQEQEQWNGILNSIVTLWKKFVACIAAFFRWVGILLRLISRDPVKEAEETIFSDLVRDSRELVKDLSNPWRKILVVKALHALPVEQRRSAAMDSALKELFGDTVLTSPECNEILEKIQASPEGKRASLLLCCHKLEKRVANAEEKFHAIQTFFLVPEETRTGVIRQLTDLFTGLRPGTSRKIFDWLEQVPTDEREQLITMCDHLPPYTYQRERARVLVGLSLLPVERRTPENTRALLTLFKNVSPTQSKRILKKMRALPNDARLHFANRCSSLVSDLLRKDPQISDNAQYAFCLLPQCVFPGIVRDLFVQLGNNPFLSRKILQEMNFLPEEERTQFLFACHQIVKNMQKTCSQEAIKTFLLIPPEDRGKAIEANVFVFMRMGVAGQSIRLREKIEQLPAHDRAQHLSYYYRIVKGVSNPEISRVAIEVFALPGICDHNCLITPLIELFAKLGESAGRQFFSETNNLSKEARKQYILDCHLLARGIGEDRKFLPAAQILARILKGGQQTDTDEVIAALSSLFATLNPRQTSRVKTRLLSLETAALAQLLQNLHAVAQDIPNTEVKNRMIDLLLLVRAEDLQEKALIQALASLCTEEDEELYQSITFRVEQTPWASRVDFILGMADSHEITSPIADSTLRYHVMRALTSLPKEDRRSEGVVDALVDLFKDMPEQCLANFVIDDLGRAEKEHRAQLLLFCHAITKGLPYWLKKRILHILLPISAQNLQQEGFKEGLTALFAGVENCVYASKIFEWMKNKIQSQAADFIPTVIECHSLVQSIPNPVLKGHVIWTLLSTLSREDRRKEGVVDALVSLLKDANYLSLQAIYMEIENRAEESRAEYILACSRATAGMEIRKKILVIQALSSLSTEQFGQENLAERLATFFSDLGLVIAEQVCELIRELEKEQRPQFMLAMADGYKLARGIANSRVQLQVIRTFSVLPKEGRQRQEVGEALLSLFENLDEDLAKAVRKEISSKPEGDRTQFLLDCQGATKDLLDPKLRVDMVKALAALRVEERSNKELLDLLVFLLLGADCQFVNSLIDTIKTWPSSVLVNALQWGKRLVEGRNELRWLLPGFLSTCALLAPRDRETFLVKFLEKVDAGAVAPFLKAIIQENPQLLANAREFFLHLLASIENGQEALQLARYVERVQNTLQLHEGDPLFLKMAEVIALNDPALAGQSYNPYVVFYRLQRERTLEVRPAEECIFGPIARWNVEGMREKAQEIQYTRADLAEGVCLEAPDGNRTTIFHKVFARLQAQGHVSVPDVRKFLENAEVKILLHPQGDSVSVYSYQLFQIGKVLAEASTEEQEAMLPAIAESIRFCSGGVKEGIALYFNNLPERYREDPRAAVVEEKVQSFLETHLYRFMTNAFADDNWIERFFSQQQQGSHATLFLKNLLYKLVGYKGHTLQFDRYTGVLSDLLITCLDSNQALSRVFQGYFRQLSLKDFVATIKREIDTFLDPETERPRFSAAGLIHFLSEGRESSTLPLFQKRILEDPSRNYTGPFTITKQGVLALLARAGLVCCEDAEVQEILKL